MSDGVIVEILRIGAVFLAALAAVKIELRWLRKDVDNAHARLDSHDVRIRELGG